jgi:hypothetical protein
MGILTFDIFDKFSCFWIGLEALNPILQKKLEVCHDSKKIKCSNCAHEWSVLSPTVSGIKYFVRDKMQNPTLYSRFHALRINLMHSTCELGKIGQEANELTPKLAESLFRAICFALDFQDWNSLPYKEALENVPLRLEVEGKLIGDYTGNLGFDGKDPYLEPSHKLVQLKIDENGSYAFENSSEFKLKIEPFKSLQPSELRMFGDKEMKGTVVSTSKKNEKKCDNSGSI